MRSIMKCKKCGKMFLEDSRDGIIDPNTKKKGCKGGCLEIINIDWIEKKIDKEGPK